MIYWSPPADWQDLQRKVAEVFRDLGFQTEVEKYLDLVKGGAEIDVYAVDETQNPKTIYVCECKKWSKRRVHQSIVHGFRKVVEESGAHHGLLIATGGFQKGSYAAASQTNVRLLDWIQFQELFEDRWYRTHMLDSLREEPQPLTSATELFNSHIERRARRKLEPNQRETYRELHKQFEDVERIVLSLEDSKPMLPLSQYLLSDCEWEWNAQEGLLDEIPPLSTALRGLSGYDDIMEARALRDLKDALTSHLRRRTRMIDKLFGQEDR